MKIISEKITLEELKKMAESGYGQLIKAVVDVNREIMAVDAEFHADLEKLLLADGSKQPYLWGINLYPDEAGDSFLEYDSMINLKPGYGNKSRGIDDQLIAEKVKKIVLKWVKG